MWWPWKRSRPTAPEVILYTRPGCHLCDDAYAVLDQVRTEFGFTIQIVNIDDDSELIREFGEQIPVVRIDGTIRFRGRVNRVLLTRLLRARR